MTDKTWRGASLAAQALGWVDPVTKAISPPIHMSSTHLRDADNQFRSGRSYIRSDNPSFDQAEALLAKLESGAHAALFASGMAAATSIFLALSPGDRIVAPKIMYWSLRHWLLNEATRWGLHVDLVDGGDMQAIAKALRRGETKLLWLETPANPLWTITDIAAACAAAHAAGAMVAVDSTVATPVLTRPIELGADFVMHSATKYLNGHSDLAAGAVIAKTESPMWRRILVNRNQLGGILGSMEAWLLLRGMRTLWVRVQTQCRTAAFLAERLSAHKHLRAVLYPGLADFPGREIAAKQMHGGFGAMLSIRAKGGETAAIATAANVNLWKRATSLGGTESMIEHRASVEGADSPVPKDLLRLSVGLEDPVDLLEDLSAALDAAHG
ncbi:MAG: PLP-dependent aspartate aminotransferase family protein [Alphaproteobacteria bacterium]